MSNRPSFIRKALATGALVTGVGIGAAGIASAATGGSSTSSTSGTSSATAPSGSTRTAPPADGAGGRMDPAAMGHGPNETLLTGTDLQKADAAAQAAVPGATVIRAETDSSGASTYEVHMKKTDGTYVTVELDSSFNVVKTISGFGPGPAGQAPHGAPDGGPGPNGAPGAYGGSASSGASTGSSTAA